MKRAMGVIYIDLPQDLITFFQRILAALLKIKADQSVHISLRDSDDRYHWPLLKWQYKNMLSMFHRKLPQQKNILTDAFSNASDLIVFIKTNICWLIIF